MEIVTDRLILRDYTSGNSSFYEELELELQYNKKRAAPK